MSPKKKSTDMRLRHATERTHLTHWAAAYKRVRPVLLAIPPETLVQVNLDVPSCVTMVLGIVPKVMPMREKLEPLPLFEVVELDHLEDYACALAQAHSLFTTATAPVPELPVLNERAKMLRDQLRLDAASLEPRGLIPAGSLTELSGAKGYKHMAFDLAALVQVLFTAWPDIEGKTAVTKEQLYEAADLAHNMSVAVGVRAASSAAVNEATDMRQRAFTLVRNTYANVRKNVVYLLGDEAASLVMPSLYAGRGGGNKAADAPDPTTPTDPATAPTPSPAQVAPVVTAVAGAAATATRNVQLPPAPPSVRMAALTDGVNAAG